MPDNSRTNTIIALCALVTSIAAVVVAVYQGIQTREHNMLSLRPYVVSAVKLEGPEGRNGIYVANDGTGVAFIKDVTISVMGNAVPMNSNNWAELYEISGIEHGCFAESWFAKGASMQATQEVPLLELTRANKPQCINQLLKFLGSSTFVVDIQYESIYKEPLSYSADISISQEALQKIYQQASKELLERLSSNSK